MDRLLNSPQFSGSFHRFFVSSFEHKLVRIGHTRCFLPSIEIKDNNVMIDGKTFFDQRVKTYLGRYQNNKTQYNSLNVKVLK